MELLYTLTHRLRLPGQYSYTNITKTEYCIVDNRIPMSQVFSS